VRCPTLSLTNSELFGDLRCGRKVLLFIEIPMERFEARVVFFKLIKLFKPQRFIPKAAFESVGEFSFHQDLFTEVVFPLLFPFHSVLSTSVNGSALRNDCRE